MDGESSPVVKPRRSQSELRLRSSTSELRSTLETSMYKTLKTVRPSSQMGVERLVTPYLKYESQNVSLYFRSHVEYVHLEKSSPVIFKVKPIHMSRNVRINK